MQTLLNRITNKTSRDRLFRGWTIAMSMLFIAESSMSFSPSVVRADVSTTAPKTGTTTTDHYPTPPPGPTCTLYGVEDQSTANSILFKQDLTTGTWSKIGATRNGYDIEEIDAHPDTGVIYGTTGDQADAASQKKLLQISRTTGIPDISTGVQLDYSNTQENQGGSFNPVTKEFWVGGDNTGLRTLNLNTGVSTLKKSVSGSPQGLAWDNAGQNLYVLYGSSIKQYNTSLNEVKSCSLGSVKAEGLEFDNTGRLLLTLDPDSHLYTYDMTTCTKTALPNLTLPYDDVETFTVDCAAPAPTCGNGVREGNEQCDGTDGVGPHQQCTNECTLQNLTYCGDEIKQTPNGEHTGGPENDGNEQCDGQDGVTAGHRCTNLCVLEQTNGSVTVNKLVDTNGDGTFESGNDTANTLGFRWGLDGVTPDRLMGSSADAATGDHDVSENHISGYHFVGWFVSGTNSGDDHDGDNKDSASLTTDTVPATGNNGGDDGHDGDDDDHDGDKQFSCQNPQGTTLPAIFSIGAGGGDDDHDADNSQDSARLTSTTASTSDNGGDDDHDGDGEPSGNDQVTVTLCNARDTGTLRVIKHVVGDALASDWQLHVKHTGVDVSGSPQNGNESGTVYTLPTDTYLVSETNGPVGFTQAFSGNCNADGLVTVVAGQEKTCTVTNTENPPEQASLTVIKHVAGGSAQSTDWTMHIKQSNSDVFSFAGTETPGTTKPLSPGSYRVTETGGPGGYALAYSGDCDGSGNVTLSAGQHKTCNLTNTREQGRIKIVKVLPDQSDPNAWTFTVSGHQGDLHHNEYATLDTGDYTVSEHGPQGYTLTGATGICSLVDGQIHLHVTTDGGTCTVTNTKNANPPQLTVIKHVIDSDKPASDFTMQVGGLTFPGSEQGTTRTLDPNTYTVTETGAAGFDLTYSGDCNSQGQVTMANDQHKTCTLTNRLQKGRIVVHKNVDTNGDGQVDQHDVSDWIWNIVDRTYQTPIISGIPTGQGRDIAPGTYWVDEDQKPGYHVVDATCDGVGYGPTEKTDLVVGPGETHECTFTNARDTGTVTVIKHVVGGGAQASDWTMHLSDFSFAGNEQGTTKTVVTGDYNVSETNGPEGFALTYSGDCDTTGHLTVTKDSHQTCTLTNTKQTGTLIVKKDVLGPDGGPIDDAHQFTVTRNGGDAKTIAEGADALYLNLPLGTYTIVEQPDAAYTLHGYSADTDDNASNGAQVTVGLGVTMLTITNQQKPNSISGVKWNDLDKDGIKDEGEPGLPNWTIQLTSACASDLKTYDLVPNGHVDASDLSKFAADYATQQTTVEFNHDNSVDPLDFACFTAHFGESSENWTANFTQETTTDANGHYAFTNLPNGSYLVNEVQKPNWAQTAPNGDGIIGPLEIHPGSVWSDQNFGNRQLSPDLTVTKTDGLTSATPGQTVTYMIVIRNSGEAVADNVTASDLLPPQATYVSSTFEGAPAPATVTPNPNGDLLNWNLGTFAVGAVKTLSVTVTLDTVFPAGTTVLTNIVTVATTTPEPNTSNNSASDVTTVTAGPSIAITKTDTPDPVLAGQTIGYTIHWSVAGNASASNVTITDPIPANTTFVSADNGGTYNATTKTVTWLLGTKAPGDNGNVGLVVRVASPIVNATIITNIATIDSSETDPATATAVTTVTSAPTLSITKTSKVTTFVNPGATVEYTVTVSNASTATDTARNVVMTDTLPAGLTFEDGTTVKTFSLGNITPGESKVITFTAKVAATAAAGTYTNTAKAKGDNTPELTATAPIEVRLPIVLAATANPKLKITKQVNKEFVNPGDVVEYTVRVENTGEATAVNVTVNDTLPKGFAFQDGGTATKTFLIGDLDPNQSFILTYKVTVGKTVKAGTYDNLAVAKADNTPAVTAKVPVEVRGIKVLATTGAGLLDWLIVILGAGIALTGLTLLLKTRRPEDQLV